MKYIKLFEAFTNQNYRESIKGEENLSTKRANGSINWFTENEILDIRHRAKELGVSHISEKNRGGVRSFFGDATGRGGLRESIINFLKGGNLCNEVNITTQAGRYNIVKTKGDFILNGKNTGNSITPLLSMIR
jgi:hypothetical protein